MTSSATSCVASASTIRFALVPIALAGPFGLIVVLIGAVVRLLGRATQRHRLEIV